LRISKNKTKKKKTIIEKKKKKKNRGKDVLPAAWSKIKTSNIVKEWKKFLGVTEGAAKFRYIQLFRSLKTYGTTFFLVKEKRGTGVGNKRIKTLPVLIGINKDNITRNDPDSREVLQTWPLTHLRRWNATQNTFTFDFGEYETDYFVVSTLEGESISQLIGGYIELLVRKRQRGANRDTDSKGAFAAEEFVPGNAGVASTTYSGGFGQAGFVPQVQQFYYQMMNNGYMMPLQYSEQMPVGPMGQAQGMSLEGGQTLMMSTDIDSASSAVMNMLIDFSTPLSTTQLNLSDFQPQAVVQDLSYLTKSMHSCVYEMLNGLQNVEMTSINSQASQISYNVAAMMQRAKVLGGLEGDNSLLAGAKGMSEAISQLLMCSKVAMENPGDAAAMDRLNAAAQNFEVASCFMNAACSGMLVDDAASQLYFESARAVACSLEDMLFECKSIEIVPAAQKMQVEYVSKTLMSTASMLSRAMTEPACQAQLQQVCHNCKQTTKQTTLTI